MKSQFQEAGTPGYANEVNELLGNIGRYAMAAFGRQNLGPGKAKKRGFTEVKRAKMQLQDEILQGNFGYEEDEEAEEQAVDPEMDAYEAEHSNEIIDDNSGLRGFTDLDRGPAANGREYMIDNGFGPKVRVKYGNVNILDEQPLSAAEAWKMAKDIEHLQALTERRTKIAANLERRNHAYYTDSYPDLAGRELRERERREEDEALREAGGDVVPKVFRSLVDDDLRFDEVGPAFHDRIRAGYEAVDSEFATRRLRELQAAWAKLEGAEEEDDEALAA